MDLLRKYKLALLQLQEYSDNNLIIQEGISLNISEELDNILQPNKPTSEEWNGVMNAIKDNKGQPQEIKTKGDYFYNHFLEILPPLMYSNTYTLCSEPYGGNKDGETTYIGIYTKSNKYYAVIASVNEFKKLIK